MAVLRFLADESCDFAAVRALRALGYDVLAVSEVMQRSVDSDLIAQAAREQRIVLTEDKDFGWLVFPKQRHVVRAGHVVLFGLEELGHERRDVLVELEGDQAPLPNGFLPRNFLGLTSISPASLRNSAST